MLLVSRIRYTPRPLHDLYYVYIRLTGRTAAAYVKAQDKTRREEIKRMAWKYLFNWRGIQESHTNLYWTALASIPAGRAGALALVLVWARIIQMREEGANYPGNIIISTSSSLWWSLLLIALLLTNAIRLIIVAFFPFYKETKYLESSPKLVIISIADPGFLKTQRGGTELKASHWRLGANGNSWDAFKDCQVVAHWSATVWP